MKLCILDNDCLDPLMIPVYGSYGAMLARLLRQAGLTDVAIDFFHTPSRQYPESFSSYDAVLLTGSKADSFSDALWVVQLREVVSQLLAQKKKLLGICFGHQLIAYCLGAKVDRAPVGWTIGVQSYAFSTQSTNMLASHQDQVLSVPTGAKVLASTPSCPIAAFTVDGSVLCFQPHPEFVHSYSRFLLEKRRAAYGEAVYQQGIASLQEDHHGLAIAKQMISFIKG